MEKKKTGATKAPGKQLTHTFIDAVTRPGSYGDGRGGNGLSLIVKPRKMDESEENRKKGGVRKTWSQRIRIKGQVRTIGLGKFPNVLLAEAREKARENAHLVAQGVDITKPPPTIPTVGQAIETLINDWQSGWKNPKTKQRWHQILKRCKPISSILVSDLTKEDVIKLLRPIWRDKPKTAENLRLHLSTVMSWSIDEGHRTMANPVPKQKEAERRMGKLPEKGHHKSLDYRQLGATLATVRDADAWWATKYLILFIAFTCVRNKEAREAAWEEIDWDNNIWNIPTARMKNGVAHSVPLSTQAMRILTHAYEKTGRTSGIIFPPEKGGDTMDGGRPCKLLEKMELEFRPHGLRTSFRNWAGARAREHLAQPVAEMVLAHKVGSQIQQVYMTSDFVEERVSVMQDWANFLREKMGPPISRIPEAQPENKENSLVRTHNVGAVGEEEYGQIVEHFQQLRNEYAQGFPDRAILTAATDVAAIALMRDGLLRPKEASKVRWSDLQQEDDGSSLLTVRSSTGNRPGTDHVAYLSPRTMQALEEMRRIRRQLGIDAKGGRILQLTENAVRKHIKKTCSAAGLTGTFYGYSPRNGMAQDLTRAGVRVSDLKRAKGWILMGTTQSERENIARTGAVAQWYAQKREKAGT